MVLRHIYSSIAFVFFYVFIPATSEAHQNTTAPEGVTVLSVRPASPAAVAGIKPQDVITAWTQGTESGSIPSPYEFKTVERDRGPRPASIILTGQRSGTTISWTLPQSDGWGILAGAGPAWADVSSIHDTIRDLGKAQRIDELIKYCREACTSSNIDPGARAWLLFAAGVFLNNYHRPSDAAEFFGLIVQDKPKGLPYVSTEAYGEWGNGYRTLHNWEAAANLYAKALHESEQINPRSLNVAFYLDKLAAMKYKSGALLESTQLSQQALRIRRVLCPSCAQTVQNFSFLGVCAMDGGDSDVAQVWLRQALQLALQLKDDDITAGVYNNLGAVAQKRGELANAETYLLLALDLDQSLHPNDPFIAELWGNLSVVATTQGNYARAEQYSERAIALETKAGPSAEFDLSKTLNNLADIKLKNHDPKESATLLTRALEIQTRLAPESVDIAITLTTYGMALTTEGSLNGAAEQFQRALSIFEQINAQSMDAAECHYQLAQLYLAKQEWARAVDHHRIAEEIRAALAPKSIVHAESLAALAALENRLGQPTVAVQHYNHALDILDSQSSFLTRASNMSFASAYAKYYAQFVSLLVQQGDTRRAFEILERSRARTLLRTLTERQLNVHGPIPASILAKERHIETLLTDLSSRRIRLLSQPPDSKLLHQIDAQIAELTEQHELLEERIRSKYPFPAPTPLTTWQIQALLPPDTGLLEYSLNENHGYVFAVTKGDISVHDLSSTTEINRLVRTAYENWSTPTPTTSTAAIELAERILDPVSPLLRHIKHLLLVTDGSLQFVPFSALPSPKSLSPNQDNLLVHFTLQTLPSVTFIHTIRATRLNNQTPPSMIAVLADPVFSTDDPRVQSTHSQARPDENQTTRSFVPLRNELPHAFPMPRLIHSREEAEAIAAIAPSNRLTLALGFAATRDTALSTAFTHSRITHYATHAVFDAANPALSGLIFSMVDKHGLPQSGFVTLQEIFRTRFSADLIVLSSCQTALGEDLSNGDGLISLTYGFLYAGAHSIVGTLWEVDDASTSEFMRLFYTGILRNRLKPAEALHEAQLNMSRSQHWADPYYWAGFVIQGDPGS